LRECRDFCFACCVFVFISSLQIWLWASHVALGSRRLQMRETRTT